jgi:hypothetical protein
MRNRKASLYAKGVPMMNYTFRYLAASVFVTAVVAFFPGDSPVRGAVDNDATSASQTVSNLNASPIYGVAIPAGYRQWELIAPSQEAGSLDELRAKLGNAIAMKAYRSESLPFPDGAVLAKVAWKRVPSAEYDAALGAPQGFVPGRATSLQFMVKDSKKYASTGGWGFGRFVNGKPGSMAEHQVCFGCHAAHVQNHDYVFTRYAP